jgi:cytochrome bd-type quinol oxidase subunit 2
MDIFSLLVIAIFVAIVVSLGSALFHLTRPDHSKKMARALTVRIALSIGLFILLMLAWWAGIIRPHGLTGAR